MEFLKNYLLMVEKWLTPRWKGMIWLHLKMIFGWPKISQFWWRQQCLDIKYTTYVTWRHVTPLYQIHMEEIFPVKEDQIYNSRFPFKGRNVRTVAYGTETLSFLGPKLWSIIPMEIKECNSLNEFKSKIRKWKPRQCPCRMCKTYIGGVGFIDVAE